MQSNEFETATETVAEVAPEAARQDRGASAVEYGLLIAGIAALIVVAVFALGPIIKEAFSDTCDSIKSGSTSRLSATCKS